MTSPDNKRMHEAGYSDAVLAAEILSFLENFSIEATPHAAEEVDTYPDFLPRGTAVYVAHPPSSGLDEISSLAARVRELGYAPVPHLAARKLAGRQQLDSALGRMRDAGSNRVLLVAGDVRTPAGPYESAMDVLETGLLKTHGFDSVGIAGHPEGIREIDATTLHRALLEKARWASDAGIAMHIVTQFGFDAQAVIDWEKALVKEGIELPVHVGMAGQASVGQLLRYAKRCGVIASTRMLARNPRRMSAQGKTSIAEELVVDFARHRLKHRDCALVRAHFFAFGGAEATVRWIERQFGDRDRNSSRIAG